MTIEQIVPTAASSATFYQQRLFITSLVHFCVSFYLREAKESRRLERLRHVSVKNMNQCNKSSFFKITSSYYVHIVLQSDL